jgi:hypothetical protein
MDNMNVLEEFEQIEDKIDDIIKYGKLGRIINFELKKIKHDLSVMKTINPKIIDKLFSAQTHTFSSDDNINRLFNKHNVYYIENNNKINYKNLDLINSFHVERKCEKYYEYTKNLSNAYYYYLNNKANIILYIPNFDFYILIKFVSNLYKFFTVFKNYNAIDYGKLLKYQIIFTDFTQKIILGYDDNYDEHEDKNKKFNILKEIINDEFNVYPIKIYNNYYKKYQIIINYKIDNYYLNYEYLKRIQEILNKSGNKDIANNLTTLDLIESDIIDNHYRKKYIYVNFSVNINKNDYLGTYNLLDINFEININFNVDKNLGYVYCLSNKSHSDNIYKIGMTSSIPEVRMKELYTTGVPSDFNIEFSIYINNYKDVEKDIHKNLEKFRINDKREFFQIDISIIKYIFDKYSFSYLSFLNNCKKNNLIDNNG